MKLKLLTTFLLIIFLKTTGFGQTCSNLIKNGDFSNGKTDWTFATTKGKEVEINSETTYFTTNNPNYTAELDKDASLRQQISVIKDVSYTVSFLYAKRPNSNTPTVTGVTVKITGGTSTATSLNLTTTSTDPKIGSFTFTATSNKIDVEFYNDITSTYGTIIDDIVLVPSTQVVPLAITIPAGVFHTSTACKGTAVQLDVKLADKDLSNTGITYSWSGPTEAVFSNVNIKNPTVTFTSSGLKNVTVTATSAGCSFSSVTSINVGIDTAPNTPVVTAPNTIECTAVTLGWTYGYGHNAYYIDIATDELFTNFVTSYNNFEVKGSSLYGYPVTNLPGGTLYYRIRAKYSCGGKDYVTPNSNIISFKTAIPVVSPAQTICYDTKPANLNLGGDNITVIKWERSENSNFSDKTEITNSTKTLNSSNIGNLTKNTYFRALTNSSCNGGYSAAVLVTVSSQMLPPTATVIQPSCVNPKGSIELGGLQSSGNIYQTKPVVAYHELNGQDKLVFQNLAAGTYQFSSAIGNCVSATLNIVIKAPLTKTWNGSSWSDTSEPTIDNAVVFTGDYSSTKDLSGCSCTVTSGAVTINSGHTMTITNEVVVNGGSLTFENNASLVQTAAVTTNQNIGKINYKRISAKMKNYDYTYWSSPVLNQTIAALSPNTSSGYYYKFVNNDWRSYGGVMEPGEGYIIMVPIPGSPSPDNWSGQPNFSQKVKFLGIPNNGPFFKGLVEGSFALVGNPYPSAISADKFILANANDITGTLWFWTHNTALDNYGSGNRYYYTADDYASYNFTGGTATKMGATTGGAAPTGNIAAGQSFFLLAKANNTDKEANFTNAMRVSGNNDVFLKYGKNRGLEKHRLWLNLTNEQGFFKQILVGYIEGATDSYDNLYDGDNYNGNSFGNFYSINDGINLSIQGRKIPFSELDEVQLGYSANLRKETEVENDFTISIDNTDGVISNQAVFLEDKLLGTVHDLRKSGYTFSSRDGNFDDRFVLKYTNKTLGINDLELTSNSLVVSVKNRIISIDAKSEVIVKVMVYDITGKTIYTKAEINASQFEISDFKTAKQVFIIKVILENGRLKTRKIIL